MTSISYLQATSNRFVVVQGRLQALGGQQSFTSLIWRNPFFTLHIPEIEYILQSQ